MDQENIFIAMDIMMESLSKISEMETDLTFGIVEICIKVSGIKINNMDQASLQIKMELSKKKDTGLMVNSKIECNIQSVYFI